MKFAKIIPDVSLSEVFSPSVSGHFSGVRLDGVHHHNLVEKRWWIDALTQLAPIHRLKISNPSGFHINDVNYVMMAIVVYVRFVLQVGIRVQR